MPDVSGAQICMHRTVAWNETDAAGHNHFSAAFRWMEEAEHQLYRALGFATDVIDCVPRVHIEIDYADRLYFGQPIEVVVGVIRVGSSSCTLAFQFLEESGAVAIRGSYVIVHTATTSDGAAPWPEPLRAALATPSVHVVRSVTSEP